MISATKTISPPYKEVIITFQSFSVIIWKNFHLLDVFSVCLQKRSSHQCRTKFKQNQIKQLQTNKFPV